MLFYKRNVVILINLLIEKHHIVIPSLNCIMSKIYLISLTEIFKQNRIGNRKYLSLLKYRNSIIIAEIHILLKNKYFYLNVIHKLIILFLLLADRLICAQIYHQLNVLVSNWVSFVHQLKPIVTVKVGTNWVLILNILECHYRLGICSKVWLLTKPNRSIANSIKRRIAQVYVALLEINVEILLKICKVPIKLSALYYSKKQHISLIIVDIA